MGAMKEVRLVAKAMKYATTDNHHWAPFNQRAEIYNNVTSMLSLILAQKWKEIMSGTEHYVLVKNRR